MTRVALVGLAALLLAACSADHPLDFALSSGGTDQTPSQELYAVGGLAADDVYAVGQRGTIVHDAGRDDWSKENENVLFTALNGIWAGDATHIIVVGDAGVILRSNHLGHWTAEVSGTTANLRGVWGNPSNSSFYAVGGDPTTMAPVILHSNGNGEWTLETVPGDGQLNAVWGPSATDIYAVGTTLVGTALIMHSTGNGTWTPQASGMEVGLTSIWGADADNIYAVGGNAAMTHPGTVVHSGGDGTWAVDVQAPQMLFGVWGSDGGDVYVVGDSAYIGHYDGAHWQQVGPALGHTLNGIWGKGSDVFIVTNGVLQSR